MGIAPIKFGTDGWRGVIAQDFTFDNVQLCAQGVANYHLKNGLAGKKIVVGFDTRFASREFAVTVAEVLAGNGFPVLLMNNNTPTPVLSSNIVANEAAGGVMITASHNPKQWNGFKYRTYYGGSPSASVIEGIESNIPTAQEMSVVRNLSYQTASDSGLIKLIDPDISYLDRVKSLIDLERLSRINKMVVVDAMHGAGGGYFSKFLGVNKIIWLKHGTDEGTDGHVDNVACFIKPGTVMALTCSDKNDSYHEKINENLEILKTSTDNQGRRLNIIELEMSYKRLVPNEDEPSSYINFYIANNGVVMPSFNDEKADNNAKKILETAFPDRKIVAINGIDILMGGGNVHCITQQQPHSI